MKSPILISLALIFIFLSCRHQQNTSGQAPLIESVASNLHIDFIQPHSDDTIYSVPGKFNVIDTIGDIFELINEASVEYLIKEYEDGEARYAVPQNLSDKYFVFDKNINIYDKSCKLVGKGNYLRHELYNLAGGSEIVSIYNIKASTKDKAKPYFMANQENTTLRQGEFVPNSELDQSQKGLLISNEYVGRSDINTMKYRYKDEFITFYCDGNLTCFYGKGINSKKVFFAENTMFHDVFFTHFIQNDMPIFLINGGQPETDFLYSFALGWNGSEFKVIK